MCTIRLKCVYSGHSGHKGMERSKQLIPQLMKLFVQYWRCKGADASGGSRGCFELWGCKGYKGDVGAWAWTSVRSMHFQALFVGLWGN